MTSALAVHQRHLSLPDCALFSPIELSITAATSKDEFVRIGKALSAIDDASGLWQCDFSLHAIRKWQDAGLELAAKATGLSEFFLKRCARIAEIFPPVRRYPNLNRNHYRVLLPFEQSKLDAWLPTAVSNRRLSANALRALAVEAFGEPVKAQQPAKHTVLIPETLWVRLAQLSPSQKTVVLIELILEEWLKRPLDEQAVLLAVAALKKEQKSERQQMRAAEKRAAKEKREAEALRRKAEIAAFREDERAKRDVEKLAARQKREVEAAERAAAQERAAEYKKKLKASAKEVRRIEPFYGSCLRASKYGSMEDAAFVAEKYSTAKGYDFEGFECEKCKSFHIRVDEVKFEAARLAAREPRPTYAERRATQWNPETKSYEADVL